MPAPSGEHEAARVSAPGAGGGVAGWGAERDARQAEATRLRAAATALQQRQAAAKRRVAEAQAALDATRTERISLERWLSRQVGSRSAAVQQARQDVNRLLAALARRAIADRANFGDDFDPARDEIVRLDHAAQNAARDVTVHMEALDAYSPGALRAGVVMMGLATVLGLTLVLAPIIWLATRVDEPPAPASISQPAATVRGAPAAPPAH
jgi:hypothetical protein